MSNNVYYGGTLVLTIKDMLVEETTWFDTTIVTITLTRPPCLVDQAWLTSQEATPVQSLQATQSIDTDSFNLSVLQAKADEIFKVVEEPFCGPILFEFVPDANQPFDYNQAIKEFTLIPQI